MNNQPSSAIENGLTSQLTPTVATIPRQCLSERGKVDLQQHRHDHQPDQHGNRQIDFRDCRRAKRVEHAWQGLPEANADDNAKRDPERQEARISPWRALSLFQSRSCRLPFHSWGRPLYPGAVSLGWLSWLRDAARQFQQTINADRLVPQQWNDA